MCPCVSVSVCPCVCVRVCVSVCPCVSVSCLQIQTPWLLAECNVRPRHAPQSALGAGRCGLPPLRTGSRSRYTSQGNTQLYLDNRDAQGQDLILNINIYLDGYYIDCLLPACYEQALQARKLSQSRIRVSRTAYYLDDCKELCSREIRCFVICPWSSLHNDVYCP